MFYLEKEEIGLSTIFLAFIFKECKKINIIKADVKSENELFSETINNEIVKNVNDFYIQTKTKVSVENVKILPQNID